MNEGEGAILVGVMLVILVVVAVIVAVGIIPYWKIYQRTGQSPWLSLLQLVPLVNIVMLFILAFGEWPVERELERLRWEKNKGEGGNA